MTQENYPEYTAVQESANHSDSQVEQRTKRSIHVLTYVPTCEDFQTIQTIFKKL